MINVGIALGKALEGWKVNEITGNLSKRASGFDSHPAKTQSVSRKRCRENDWVLDLDIKSFFDSIDHDLLMKAVRRHTREKWVCLYIGRWLKAPVEMPDGELRSRDRGTPQGGVASPLLANLFLHYVFDHWMSRKYPGIRFERYADESSLLSGQRQEEGIPAHVV